MSGLALITGSAGAIITMIFHPTGHDLFVPGQFASVAHVAIATHTLALVSLPVLLLGAFGLSHYLASPNRLAFVALVMYGLATIAAMNAAVVSGLVAPQLVRQIITTTPPSSDVWRIVFDYSGDLNQGFARVFVVASSAAIVLWSVAILRGKTLARGIGIYGSILGPVTVLAVLSGHLKLGVHGFGMVVLGQAVWFVIVGVLLCRADIHLTEPASI